MPRGLEPAAALTNPHSRIPNPVLQPGCLHVVATPIGHLDDLSPRALKTLAEADLICAEDTRHTQQLLSAKGLKRPLLALHEHNEAAQVEAVLARLRAGEQIALVSDAGTPLISDPGFRLVCAARAAGLSQSRGPAPRATRRPCRSIRYTVGGPNTP